MARRKLTLEELIAKKERLEKELEELRERYRRFKEKE